MSTNRLAQGRAPLVALLLPLLFALVACAPSLPPSVDDVTVTKTVDKDSRPTAPTQSFKSDDGKIFASVKVSNLAPGSRVASKWYYGQQEITAAASSVTADRVGSGYYAFSIASSSALPPGNWKIEILLDGKITKTAAFQVIQ